MGTIGSLLGALIGAAIGIAAHVALSGIEELGEMSWFVIVTGLLTGLGARLVGGSGSGLIRGALAMVVALAAILATPYAKSAVLAKEPAGEQLLERKIAPAATEEAPADVDSEEVVVEETPLRIPGEGRIGAPGVFQAPQQFDPLEYVYMAVAALVAYGFGRGADPKEPRTVEHHSPTAPAEPGHLQEPVMESRESQPMV